MALFPQDALNPGVRKREVFGWAMYDFANSGYTTVVITAVFAAYFVGGIAGKARLGDLRLDGGAQHLLRHRHAHHAQHRRLCRPARRQEAPADAVHRRLRAVAPRRWRWPGRARVALAMLLIIVSNTFYSYGESLTAAFLPELARPESLGKVSGWGWGFGYFGGMLALGICLGYVLWAQGQGIPAAQLRAGHDADHGGDLRRRPRWSPSALLRERAQPNPRRAARKRAARPRCSSCGSTFTQARRYRTSCGCWRAPCSTRAAWRWRSRWPRSTRRQVIGFKQQETMVLIFVLNLAAAGRRLRLGLPAGPHRPQARAGQHAGRLDRHLRDRRAPPRPRAASGGPRRSPACAWGPASRPAAPWRACSRRGGSWRSSTACGPSRSGWPASSGR